MTTLFDHPDHSLYSNGMTFLRQPMVQNIADINADVVVLGLPFDMATSGRPGARLGPDAIRRASVHLAWEETKYPWTFKLFERLKVADAGDFTYPVGDAEYFTAKLEHAATGILSQGKTILGLGGDHFVTLPLLRAHAKRFGKMALVHFDAHTDTYSNGSRYDHGTMFYHAPKEGLIDVDHSIQIGIRTDFDQSKHEFAVIDAMAANDLSAQTIAEQILARVGDLPVYITFDIDCLDPAFAPGTGTPVCGGLSSDKVLKILRALKGINMIGMDVVEVSPSYDQSELTAIAAATIASELLHLWALKHKY
ncbi:agmatinase [Pseudoalteromonas prydzensis]|jgi:agmatinase|uniref:Agmatinase n=1 Tax=Pseudoalteromonas prydzensis TaxID=182141 RepID=A0ABR9FP15_9GAMM|nr:agmatinase [Pseudoalteromonas prydzensis]MBE0378444.1 agmatinase [Pseudoalteromonas prydzensis ACAM 620]MBE0458571.1 agmatinase [Pseudoalteromonas prydzensis]